MNILHLLSQNHLTGAEVYATELINAQVGATNSVFQISNDFFTETAAIKIKLAVETKSRIEFVKNIFWLRRFLIEKNIHVIHTHSRAAAKLAYWARFGIKAGLVATIHGRQHPSFSKKVWNQYGDFVVAVCERIKEHLIKDFNYNTRRLSVTRNPVSENIFSFESKKENFLKSELLKIAVVGRTTGPKGERTRLIVNALTKYLKAESIPFEITLVGASNAAITMGFDDEVLVKQLHVEKLTSKDYEKYDLVVGSGRVAVESILTGIPTLCFGEASYLGLARASNIESYFHSNFGDIEVNEGCPKLIETDFEKDIQQLFSSSYTLSERQEIAKTVWSEFNSQKIARRIFRLYEASYFLRNYSKWIPILMYHKIPDQEIQSQHKIYVTKENFRKHLQFFTDHGFQTLTFSDLKKFKSGLRPFSSFPKKPLILTFDDGYTDNLVNASPLLKEFDFKAQLFLLADKNINNNAWDASTTEPSHDIVSGSDRQKWLDSAFEIGSHGFSHQRITQMSELEARKELHDSRLSLEKEFGIDVPVYAFTYGDTNAKTAKLAFEEGYDYAVNTDTGGFLLEESPYQIFRANIFPNETTASLKKKTAKWYRRYYYWKRKK